MDNKFLLTYYRKSDQHSDYEWFENEEDLKDFVTFNKDDLELIEATEVCQAKEIII